jgi:hypothetical protein
VRADKRRVHLFRIQTSRPASNHRASTTVDSAYGQR